MRSFSKTRLELTNTLHFIDIPKMKSGVEMTPKSIQKRQGRLRQSQIYNSTENLPNLGYIALRKSTDTTPFLMTQNDVSLGEYSMPQKN